MKDYRWWDADVGSALRVPGANPVDGLPPARHTDPRWIGVTLDPRRSVILVDIFMFLVIFYSMSYWFGTLEPFISYWSLISCEYPLWWSSKPRLTNQRASPQKMLEKMMKFSNLTKILIKNSWIWKFTFESSSWKNFSGWIINEVICSTSSRRKPGWRFTAGSTFTPRRVLRKLGDRREPMVASLGPNPRRI